jgi:hypothetical protein
MNPRVTSHSTSQNERTTRLGDPYHCFPLCFWSGREDLNLRPLGPESWVPQHSNMLLFKKLQPPSNSAPFTIFYHVLTSLPRRVLSLLDTNWTQIFGAHDRFSASDRSHGPRPCSLLSSRFEIDVRFVSGQRDDLTVRLALNPLLPRYLSSVFANFHLLAWLKANRFA